MLNTLQRVTLHALRNGMVITAISMATVALAQAPAGGATPAPSTPPPAVESPPPAPPANTGTIKIGKEIKATLGKVTDVEKADNGCLIEFRSDKGDAQIELGLAKFCTLKPSLKGRQVELEYRLETVLANECMGNPKCRKTETLPVIVEVKVLN